MLRQGELCLSGYEKQNEGKARGKRSHVKSMISANLVCALLITLFESHRSSSGETLGQFRDADMCRLRLKGREKQQIQKKNLINIGRLLCIYLYDL